MYYNVYYNMYFHAVTSFDIVHSQSQEYRSMDLECLILITVVIISEDMICEMCGQECMQVGTSSRAKVGLIMGPRAINMQASKNILLTKKRTLTHVCVWCEREKKVRRDRRKIACVCGERERDTQKDMPKMGCE